MERVLEPSTTPHAASEARQNGSGFRSHPTQQRANGALHNHPVTTRPTILSATVSRLYTLTTPIRFAKPATVNSSADLLRGHEALY
jgi:hypothetical protein